VVAVINSAVGTLYLGKMSLDSGEITLLLRLVAQRDAEAQDRLFEIVYPQLRRLAAVYLSRERHDHTLQPTALVHEAFLRIPGEGIDWQGRGHFFAIAATAMRRVLVDHARGLLSAKRSGQRIELTDAIVYDQQRPEEIVELDRAMDRLAGMHPRQARVVEMRFFAGMTEEQIAGVLGVASRTVRRDWQIARAWLYEELIGAPR
jgi:RNA polymerase sigma-70 factor (ECF subfamily)